MSRTLRVRRTSWAGCLTPSTRTVGARWTGDDDEGDDDDDVDNDDDDTVNILFSLVDRDEITDIVIGLFRFLALFRETYKGETAAFIQLDDRSANA